MRVRTIVIITAILFIVSAFCGMLCKRTFTDYDKPEYYNIGELPGTLISQLIKEDKKQLTKSKYILKITPMGDIEFDQDCVKQKVKVVKVFKGENIKAGDTFYAIKSNSYINIENGIKEIGMNYVNQLKRNQDYLAFFERRLETKNYSDDVYITPNIYLPPFYSYKDRENTVIEIPENAENTNVPYVKVKDNEFFVTDKSGLDELNSLKKFLINLYK